MAILGVVHLPTPLHGDAALYQAGARAMADGGTLYRDFWDLKQPGIYLFHGLAGTLLGFGELGLHMLELATLLVVSLAQVLLLRRVFSPPWLASFVPVASFGAYYSVTTDWHLTQPAILLCAPLFTILAVASFSWSRPRLAWMVAGAAGAVAIAFKIATAPLVVALVAAGILLEQRDQAAGSAFLRLRLFPVAAGAILAGGAGILWLQFTGGWDGFVWTLTSWHADALATRGPHPIRRVIESTFWFAKGFAPWLLLAAAAPLAAHGARPERVYFLSALWIAGGAALVAVEPFAGWEFDYLMLVVPLAILAIRGVQGILEAAARAHSNREWPAAASLLRHPHRTAFVVVVAASLPGLVRWLPKARDFCAHAPHVGASEYAYQRALHGGYESAWHTTAFLREEDAASGAIYVFGDPVVMRLADRPSASAVHGWACEVQPPSSWRRVEQDLRVSRPPYIFVGSEEEAYLDVRGEGVRALLAEFYEVRERTPLGTWYEAR